MIINTQLIIDQDPSKNADSKRNQKRMTSSLLKIQKMQHNLSQSCSMTEESLFDVKVPSHVKYFESIQSLDLRVFRKLFRMSFTVLPSVKELLRAYDSIQSQNSLTITETEESLFQCFVLAFSQKSDSNLTYEELEEINNLMPVRRTTQQWQQLYQQYINQSAYSYPWNETEDEILKEIVMKYISQRKGSKWSRICQDFNEQSGQKYSRLPKQCRERWGNKLDPQINRGEWTEQEDLFFLQLILQYGRKWVEITQRLSQITDNKKRTEFALKHRYRKLVNSLTQDIPSKRLLEINLHISNDWTVKQANEIILKINELDVSAQSESGSIFSTCQPLTKQIKINSEMTIVVIKNNKMEIVNLSHLLLEMNQHPIL